jgi:hypothetical protein
MEEVMDELSLNRNKSHSTGFEFYSNILGLFFLGIEGSRFPWQRTLDRIKEVMVCPETRNSFRPERQWT